MSVDLRGLQTGVTQQLLDHTQIGAPVEQMCSESVPKGMGVGRHRRPAVEDPANVAWAQTVAPLVEKDGLSWAVLPLEGGPGPGGKTMKLVLPPVAPTTTTRFRLRPAR